MAVEPLLFVYCVLIVLASVGGGHLPSMMRMTHLRTQLLMSFVGGLMLGIATLHLLPHASEVLGASHTGIATLIGIVAMFLLLRAFYEHHHHGPTGDDAHAHCDHEHHIQGGHQLDETTQDHAHNHSETPAKNKGLGWIGMLFGLWLHTFVDGVALAASALAEHYHGAWLGLAGLGTFLAVALHKPLDAFAITSTMNTSGWSPGQQNFVNLAFSLACPIGALLFYFGVNQLDESSLVLGWGLAISGGFFICIALSDLLPEVAFHDHDRLKLTTALFIGIGLAVLIESLPGHEHDGHDHGRSPAPATIDLAPSKIDQTPATSPQLVQPSP
ncbi:ZIP family metal transporter [Planctomycetes bacterium K23_9]|uniref:Zinc transporter ZupT n=1 Tax=Stieleria marina TaxID=1930275 RepID=A0A517NRP0_9BACT|nr:zinc transporter ZupT [Planctomycetes bacterium K23_9]